jgi:MFS family permease
VISLGVLAYGYDSAFIGTTITQKSFMRDFGLDQMSKTDQNAVSSNLTSICTLLGDSEKAAIGVLTWMDRLCWRLLRRVVHVLLSRTPGSENDGSHIGCYLSSWSVSAQRTISTNENTHPSIDCSILCTVPTHQLGMIYAGRLLTGLGVGGIAAVSPIYIAELSPPAIRGRLTGLYANRRLSTNFV